MSTVDPRAAFQARYVHSCSNLCTVTLEEHSYLEKKQIKSWFVCGCTTGTTLALLSLSGDESLFSKMSQHWGLYSRDENGGDIACTLTTMAAPVLWKVHEKCKTRALLLLKHGTRKALLLLKHGTRKEELMQSGRQHHIMSCAPQIKKLTTGCVGWIGWCRCEGGVKADCYAIH